MIIVEIFLGMVVLFTPLMLAAILVVGWLKVGQLISIQRIRNDRDKEILSLLRSIEDELQSKKGSL